MKKISHQTSCIDLLHGWSIQYCYYLGTILKTKNYFFIISAIKLELKILELDITREELWVHSQNDNSRLPFLKIRLSPLWTLRTKLYCHTHIYIYVHVLKINANKINWPGTGRIKLTWQGYKHRHLFLVKKQIYLDTNVQNNHCLMPQYQKLSKKKQKRG